MKIATISDAETLPVAGGMARVFASPFSRIALAPPDEGAGGSGGDDEDEDADADDLGNEGEGTDADKKEGLKDADAKLLKENLRRKNQLREAKQALDTTRSELDGLKQKFQGIDPDQVRQLIAEKAERDRQEAEKAGDFERVKEMMAEAHRTQLEQKEAELSATKQTLERATSTIGKLTVNLQFSNSKYIHNNLIVPPAKAQKLWADHFDPDDNGTLVAFDKPRGSEGRTKLVDGQNRPLSFDDAIKHLVEKDADKDTLIKSTLKNGAGSKSSDVDANKKPNSGQLFGAARITAALAARKSA